MASGDFSQKWIQVKGAALERRLANRNARSTGPALRAAELVPIATGQARQVVVVGWRGKIEHHARRLRPRMKPPCGPDWQVGSVDIGDTEHRARPGGAARKQDSNWDADGGSDGHRRQNEHYMLRSQTENVIDESRPHIPLSRTTERGGSVFRKS